MHTFSVIHGVGGYLPEKIITNHQLSETLDTSHDWIVRRTGIEQRHLADNGQMTSHLATKAAEGALHMAHKKPEDVDLILLATSTSDHAFPPAATRVHHNISAHNAVAFDINAACSGFLFALSVADAYLKQGMFRNALVIGGEVMSSIVDWSDRQTAILFGDGAGAVFLEAHKDTSHGASPRGILSTELFSHGDGYDLLYVQNTTEEGVQRGKIVMNGAEVFYHAVRYLEASAEKLLAQSGHAVEDIRWFVSHQANKRILTAVGERMGVPSERLVFTGNLHANTSAASIPLALWELSHKNMLKPGDLVFLQAFGAGFTGGSCLLRW